MKLTEMTAEQKRIAIAEACGFSEIHREQMPTHSALTGKRNGRSEWLPDYLSDLNAMHDAERLLTRQQCERYDDQLHKQSGDAAWLASSWAWNATAEQRADAFLLATGRASL